MKSTLREIYDFVSQAFGRDERYTAVEARFIAAQAKRAVDRAQQLVDDFKSWSGGEPPSDFDQINTHVTAALPAGPFPGDEARRLLIEWGTAEGNFR
jgi:hypothetical protein